MNLQFRQRGDPKPHGSESQPLDGEEMGRFLRWLEYGEIQEGEFFAEESRNAGRKISSTDSRSPQPPQISGRELGRLKSAQSADKHSRVQFKTLHHEQDMGSLIPSARPTAER